MQRYNQHIVITQDVIKQSRQATKGAKHVITLKDKT